MNRLPKLFRFLAITFFFLSCSKVEVNSAPVAAPPEINRDALVDVEAKGWTNLLKLLVAEGVDPHLALKALGSREMPEKEMLTFNINPQEKRSIYKGVNTEKRREHAFQFYLLHESNFRSASEFYGVPESVILAILQVETSCGQFTGNSSVFPAIARLANAGDPVIIKENVSKNLKKDEEKVFRRAAYLESTFLPHLVATFKIAPDGDVHSLKGSFAGAMGLPQFMPGNIISYGADGNRDGKIDLYDPADAIPSTANYLKMHGWNSPSLPNAKRRAVIWEYNRSIPYVDTVLSMADLLHKKIISHRKNVDSRKSTRKSSRAIKSFR